MHLRAHNNDFDIHLRNVNYSAKLQIVKIHNDAKNKLLSVQHELGVRIFI